jgi:DNA-binding CsgD family transcriptional regulator
LGEDLQCIEVKTPGDSRVSSACNQRGTAENEIEKLSKREREVLDHLVEGISYKEIADVLSLSIDTVRMHIKGIYSKLHVHSRGEAVAKYLRK